MPSPPGRPPPESLDLRVPVPLSLPERRNPNTLTYSVPLRAGALMNNNKAEKGRPRRGPARENRRSAGPARIEKGAAGGLGLPFYVFRENIDEENRDLVPVFEAGEFVGRIDA